MADRLCTVASSPTIKLRQVCPLCARCVGRGTAYSARHSPLSVQLNTHLYDAYRGDGWEKSRDQRHPVFVGTTHALLTLRKYTGIKNSFIARVYYIYVAVLEYLD